LIGEIGPVFQSPAHEADQPIPRFSEVILSHVHWLKGINFNKKSETMRRRDFVKSGSILAAAAATVNLHAASTSFQPSTLNGGRVDFINDGLLLSPAEYAEMLMKMADEGQIPPDYYSRGGIIEELENKFALLLGKESAIFMPTGTMANHLAVRALAGNNRRVIVQERSHLYNDSGDCCQRLSGLNLIPAGSHSVEIPLVEMEEIVKNTRNGRVETRIGAVSIETPVRRQFDRLYRYDNLKSITGFARNGEIKTHLDGARIFVQAVHENIAPARYGELFDTVYTSLWKCFNAASGAILAGDKEFTANLFHERRMLGGSLPAAWATAAIALRFADSFLDDYKAAWQRAEEVFSLIQADERFSIVRFENGSHVLRLNVKTNDLNRFAESAGKQGIQLPVPDERGFLLKINPSLNRVTAQNLAGYFIESLQA
jgi:threonine aldolase